MDNVSCETLIERSLIMGLASAGPLYCHVLGVFQLLSESLSAIGRADTLSLQTTDTHHLESLFTSIGDSTVSSIESSSAAYVKSQ